jgi:hypothetical protein
MLRALASAPSGRCGTHGNAGQVTNCADVKCGNGGAAAYIVPPTIYLPAGRDSDADTLAVQAGRARGGPSALADPLLGAEGGVDLFPQSLLSPAAEVVIDGLPGRQVMGNSRQAQPARSQ